MKLKYLAYMCLLTALIFTSNCFAEPLYTVRDIGSLEGGSYGSGISENGMVAGWSYVNASSRPFVAYYWNNGQMTALGTLGSSTEALAINDKAEVVGWSQVYQSGLYRAHAFLWKNGNMQDLGVVSTMVSSVAHDINNNSQIVGVSDNYGFLWQNGSMTKLVGVSGLANENTGAYSISDTGNIVGSSGNHAAMWSGNTAVDLGTLPQYNASTAYGVNDMGQAVGWSTTNGVDGHAFFWENGIMTDMGTLGGSYSRAYAVNRYGTAVGYSKLAGWGQRAFIWQNGVMTDLNSLVPAGYADWLEFAVDINDSGQIMAQGWKDGIARSYVLTPVPEPNSIFVLLSGITGLGAAVMRKRRAG